MRYILFLISIVTFMSCHSNKQKESAFTGQDGEVKLVILDPGHFHAALIQKYPISKIDRDVHVYAPKGKELDAYMSTVDGFNQRTDNPADWNQVVYSSDDYLDKMVEEHDGNVVVLAGNNQKKIEYIIKSLNAGFNVLADKPLIINPRDFNRLDEAYQIAQKHGVLLSDMMTERYNVTNILQGLLINEDDIFGRFIEGSTEKPAIESESVHHFLKTVSGSPLIRPAWYYDVERQGEGIVDVTTHLIDLINYNCFPGQVIDYKKDVRVNDAGRYATQLTIEDYKESTGLEQFPDYLSKYIDNNVLNVYANGNINYMVKGIPVRITVKWNLRAPEGGGDTHSLIARGTNADVMILQGKDQGYIPELYIKKNENVSVDVFNGALNNWMARIQSQYPGIKIENSDSDENLKHIIIPNSIRKDHEEHFSLVVKTYIDYLQQGELPEWEIKNTLTKYYITTKALEIARGK